MQTHPNRASSHSTEALTRETNTLLFASVVELSGLQDPEEYRGACEDGWGRAGREGRVKFPLYTW